MKEGKSKPILRSHQQAIVFAEAFAVGPEMPESPKGSAIGKIPKWYAIRKSIRSWASFNGQ